MSFQGLLSEFCCFQLNWALLVGPQSFESWVWSRSLNVTKLESDDCVFIAEYNSSCTELITTDAYEELWHLLLCEL